MMQYNKNKMKWLFIIDYKEKGNMKEIQEM